jgi:hypothetical protein
MIVRDRDRVPVGVPVQGPSSEPVSNVGVFPLTVTELLSSRLFVR